MSCYYPLIGIPNGVNPNGKTHYAIRPFKDSVWEDLQTRPPLQGPAVKIPCGKCIGCRLDYSRQWANRCMLEAQYYPPDQVWFATITYNDKYVPRVISMDPETGKQAPALTLRKRDFQLWMKRLRRHFPETKIRFFASGEYGSETLRPHYHAILFGLPIHDLELYEKSGNFQLYTSKSIAKTWSKVYNDNDLRDTSKDSYAPLAMETWIEGDLTYEPYGRIVLSPCSWETCAYTARYTAKKSNTFFPQFFESFGLEAPFTLMSRKPGIAGQYYQDHPEVYDYRYINIPGQEGGIKFTVPRYFDRLLEKEDPEALACMKEIRQKIVTELDKEKDTKTTYGIKNRLEVAAHQKEAVAKMLRRSAI